MTKYSENVQTGSLEGQNAIKHNQRVPLSVQELVDCSAGYLNSGCKGGSIMFSFRYIEDYKGISTENSYPYTGKEGPCARSSGKNAGITVKGYTEIGYDEDELKAAVGKFTIYTNINRYSDNMQQCATNSKLFLREILGGMFSR